jgi:integrase/recombinase XerD
MAGVGPNKTTMDYIAAFIEDMRSRNLSPDTIRTYSWILRDFNNFMQDRENGLLTITRDDLRSYVDRMRAKGLSHKSASLRFGAICSLYEYLVFEEIVDKNPAVPVRKRYLQTYKSQRGHTHQLISKEQAGQIVQEMVDIRDKALTMLLFKTGIRIKELIALDVDDINWKNFSITLKPTAKRTNRIVFFDGETAEYLRRWLRIRDNRTVDAERALFVSSSRRLQRSAIHYALVKAATRIGLHDATSPNMEDHFSAHCARHWFTTMLDRAGMKREHIETLRGDVGKAAIDLYIHNDLDEIRKEYLRCIPRLGV